MSLNVRDQVTLCLRYNVSSAVQLSVTNFSFSLSRAQLNGYADTSCAEQLKPEPH